MMASNELETLAERYATRAVEFDRKGDSKNAVANYERAIEILNKLIILHPDTPQCAVYQECAKRYKNRISILKGEIQVQEVKEVPVAKDEVINRFAIKEKPNIRWEDIAGLQDAKKALIEAIVYPVMRPDLFPFGWPRGVLLYGPPGCGKTLLAAAVSREIDALFLTVDAASIMSKWLGESEKNVAQLFNIARKESENGRPAIIFIDEIDSLMGVHSEEVGGETRTRNQFLKEMDGVIDKNSKLHVYVIGATNKPWNLDKPFIRRFQKRIYVSLPDISARVEFFKIYAKNMALLPDVDFYELSMMTEGYTGSDIRDLFQDVQMYAIREFFETGRSRDQSSKPRKINMDDFRAAVANRKPSVAKELIMLYEKWNEKFKAL